MLTLKQQAEMSIKEVDELVVRDSTHERNCNSSAVDSSDDEDHLLLSVTKVTNKNRRPS